MSVAASAFLTLILCGAEAEAQKSWAQSYGARSYERDGTPTTSATSGSGYDVAKGIARMPDGGFVVAGHLELPQVYRNVFNPASGSHKNVALVRYAPDGSILWQQLIRQDNDRTLSDGTYQPASTHVYSVLTDAQGNIFICGGKGNTDNGAQVAFVAKFNANGTLIWQRGIGTGLANGATPTAALTRDGGVLVTLAEAGNGTLDPALAKLNSDGSLAFYAVYDQAIQYNTMSAVCESATENNVYVGLVGDIAGLTLLRIDGSGNLLGLRNTRDGAGRRTELQIAVVPTADGGYATLTRAFDFEGVVLRKFDRNLVPIFEKWIRPAGFGFVGDSLVAEADGGFLIGGATGARQAGGAEVYPGGGGYEAGIMRVSATGDLQFVSALGGPRDEGGVAQLQPLGTYLTRAADGGYAFTTTTFSYIGDSTFGKPDWWTVKTDVNRRVPNFGGLMADLPLEWFTVTDVPNTGTTARTFTRVAGNVTVSTAPNFIFENLATKTGINKPDVMFQAANIAPAPGPPLSPTSNFTVNGSSTGIGVPADSVLRFRVNQPSNAAGLIVRVQFSTTPNSEISWTDLNNGSFGRMIFDVTNGSYVLNTTSYPRNANVHFRAISKAPTRSDSVSNVVGPFNLTSSAQHLGRTILSTTRNGVGAKINFRAFDETHPAGMSMRIQSSTSPGDEGLWTDLPDGNGGKMAPYRNPGDFFLDSKDYPANGAVYFRTVASAPGYVDSPSRGVGPFNLSNSPAPTATVTSPATPGDFLGGDFQFPVLLSPGAFTIEANAQPNGGPGIKHIGLIFDGETIERVDGGNASRSYTAAAPGDHVVEAFALDELNVTGDSTPIYVRVAPAFGKIYNRVNDGDWSDPAGWSDQDALQGVPGANDLANIGSFNVSLSQDVTALAVALHGGSINGPAALTINGTFTISAGRLPIPNLTIERGGTLLLANEADIAMGGNVTNLGKVMLIGRAGITGIESGSSMKSARTSDSETVERKQFFKGVVAFFKNLGDLVLGRRTGGKRTTAPPAPQPVPDLPRTVLLDIDNGGNVIGQDAAGLIGQDGAGVLSDNGLGLIGQDGAGIISNDGASIISNDGASIISNDGASIISNDGASIISGGGGNIISGGAGNFLPGARIAAATKDGSKAAIGQAGFVQTGGTTNLTGIRLIGPVVLNGGILGGSGVIVGDLTNDGGYIAPGNSAGSITVDGNFTQTANGSLLLEVGGTNSYFPEFDRLKIAGSAALGGKVSVKTINGFTPDPSTRFVPLVYESATGSFASSSGNVQLELTDTGAALTIAGANPPSAKLLNIATRLRVERGQDALIGGFIITGSAPKRVIIRALGPSLAAGGIAGALADPTLELFRPDGSEFNNNWRDSQEGDIAATGIQPRDDREAAIVATLEAGVAYTAVVRGVNDSTGVGLVEVYDLDAAAPSTLANISTRGLVQTGENVMIGGLIIGGDQPAKVLVRAIGPSLGAAGVAGALQDPTLELYTANGAVITNDDWRATQEGEIIATTVPPSDSREAAILATLPPGNYTAIVRGKGDTAGVALVEAYNLP